MVADDLKKYRLILASRSPRRRELMDQLGFRFDVIIKEWSEEYPASLKGEEIALYVARMKSDSFKSEIKENEIVITADTVVWCNGKILEKPVDEADAIRILNEISCNTHEVITGVCLLSKEKQRSFAVSTSVTFGKLTDEEILFYVRNYKPYDKAGGYGIQEWIGITSCSRIEGSYFNVMGLPSDRLYRELHDFIK